MTGNNFASARIDAAPPARPASAIYASLDTRMERLESSFGYEELLRYMDQHPLDRVNRHVELYRKVIRAGGWALDEADSGLEDFVADFEASCAVYVDVAFTALDHLTGRGPDFFAVLELATVSEALRGQLGKQSRTGLDARLESMEVEMEAVVGAALGAPLDDVVSLLGTPVGEPVSAEAAMLDEFLKLRTFFSTVPSTSQILVDSEAGAAARGFLRRHCRWSRARLQQVYHQLDDDQLARRVAHARRHRDRDRREQEALIEKILVACPTHVASRILELAEGMRTLNALNLSIEPLFSFKGFAGFPHGEVFERCGGAPQERIEPERLRSAKWALLAAAAKKPAGKE